VNCGRGEVDKKEKYKAQELREVSSSQTKTRPIKIKVRIIQQ
jgi:hypothetical protein